MRNFREINVWNKSKDFVKHIYEVTQRFPETERFGLVNQIRRTSVSVPSNIAEGASRSSEKDFRRFLEIAIGSAFEVETQLLIVFDLKFLNELNLKKLIDEIHQIQKMLNVFIQKLKA